VSSDHKLKSFFFLFLESLQGPHEKRLLHTLLDHYNVLERPVGNESEPLQLSFGLTLMQIIDVVSLIYKKYSAPEIFPEFFSPYLKYEFQFRF
jgi:hypothetical protein